MRQVQSGKSNVAWFTLAECVSRGEKERALGVYRLLSHSLDDSAVTAQLEGDILWAFNDKGAVEKYLVAAQRYQHNNRYREAFTVLEHCRIMAPSNRLSLERLIDLSLQIKSEERLSAFMQEYLSFIGDQETIAFALGVFEQASSIGRFHMQSTKRSVLLKAAQIPVLSETTLESLLVDVAADCLASGDERLLQYVRTSLEQTNITLAKMFTEALSGKC